MAAAAPRKSTEIRLAYLDGLRGWMALVVVLTHLFRTWLLEPVQLERHGAAWLNFLLKWTPLGALTDGKQAVYVFFVISGIALSYPVLRSAAPAHTLAAMAAYRYPRLTVPIFVSCLLAWILLATGCFVNDKAALLHANGGWWANLYAFPPDFQDMVTFALWRTYGYTEQSWNTVLWTMEVELSGSFLLFALLGFVPLRWFRLVIAAGLALWWLNASTSNGYLVGFFVGYGLAELLAAAERSPRLQTRLQAATPMGWVLLVATIACSTLMQSKSLGGESTGHMLQFNVIAALAVCGVILVRPVQALLSSSLSHFLGRISFGLYLTHLLVICSFSSALYVATIERLPYWLVVLLIGGLSLAAAVAAGYAFTVLVEERLLSMIKQPIKLAAYVVLDWAHKKLPIRWLRAMGQ